MSTTVSPRAAEHAATTRRTTTTHRYGSADAAERWIRSERERDSSASETTTRGTTSTTHRYGSADAAERWIESERNRDAGASETSGSSQTHRYGSADAAEHWIEAERDRNEAQTPAPNTVLAADDPANPYQGDYNSTQVEVVPWDPNDDNPNDHLEGILTNQGYSIEEIYAADDQGQTMLDRVAEANDLRDANLISPGQNLVVPTTQEPTPTEQPTPETSPETPETPAPEAPAEPPPTTPPASEEPPAPAEMNSREALEVIDQEFNWIDNPDTGQGNGKASVNDDLRRFDAHGDWNRDGYVDNLTNSVNPDTGNFYTEEEAGARADRLEQAAQTVLGDEELLNLVDGGNDGDTGDVTDGKFNRDDIQRASQLLEDDTQAAFETVDRYGEAFAYANPHNSGDANQVYRGDFERVANLADNEDFADYVAGDITFDEFQRRDGDAAELVGSIYDHLPEGTDRLDALDEMIGAAGVVLTEDRFDIANVTDGNAGYERGDGDYITLNGDVSGLLDLA
ncbi:MAG: hypothetical protein AB7S38_33335 [Vulcanimicrobiota bacterium]